MKTLTTLLLALCLLAPTINLTLSADPVDVETAAKAQAEAEAAKADADARVAKEAAVAKQAKALEAQARAIEAIKANRLAKIEARDLVLTEAKPKDPAPEAVVRTFLDLVPDQKADDIRALLADTKTCHITQEADPQRPGIWTETWEEWLKWLPTHDQSVHNIDKLAMSKLTNDLAVVTLAGHIDQPPTNFHAVIVLTKKQDTHWKILSWTQENSIPPAKQ